MLVGLNIILIIAIMGGAIAFIGDKLGTKIGKRRMSIFGLRPKHTSIIMTIVTGDFNFRLYLRGAGHCVGKCSYRSFWYGAVAS